MSKHKEDKLVLLISTLSKAEKRNFKLYVNRNSNSASRLFVQLFDFISKNNTCNEKLVLNKISSIKKSQLSNLKANLFKQILTCLRLIDRSKFLEINVREQIDFAKLLYERGLYKVCLEILDKAKKQAIAIDYETLALSIIYFEKKIESQHVTGSMAPTADKLTAQSDNLLYEIGLTNKLSNASLLLYGEYLKHGYIKNEEDYIRLKNYFNALIPQFDLKNLKFYQKLYLFQSYVWYNNMTQDFVNYYKYALKWVKLFVDNKPLQITATTQFIKGMHNLLNALFMAGKRDRFNKRLKDFDNYEILNKPNITVNEESLFHLVKSIHFLNSIFLNANYNLPSPLLEKFEIDLQENAHRRDKNRMLVFNYKLGCVYFGIGDLNKTIEYLNKVCQERYVDFRQDIQSFARILNLIAHFDLGNETLVSYQVKSLYRFLSKLKELQKVQLEIIKFLRRTPKMKAHAMKNEFLILRDKLSIIQNEKYEKRPFLYLDIISWLESKIENRPIKQIIKAKMRIEK